MWLRAGTSLLLLSMAVHAHAASCPDYAASEREIAGILKHETLGSLPEAYERLAEAWSCAHPSADRNEFIRWIRQVPSTMSLAPKLDATGLVPNRVFVIWTRHDVPDGGHAALYVRRDRGWQLAGSVKLGSTPHIVGVLRHREIVISEENRIPATTAADIRVLRIDGETIEQSFFAEGTNNPKLLSKSPDRLVIAFERFPRHFSLVDRSAPLRYKLTLKADGQRLLSSTQPTTPSLEAIDRFCETVQTRAVEDVALPSVARRLPACRDIRVSEIRSRRACQRV